MKKKKKKTEKMIMTGKRNVRSIQNGTFTQNKYLDSASCKMDNEFSKDWDSGSV